MDVRYDNLYTWGLALLHLGTWKRLHVVNCIWVPVGCSRWDSCPAKEKGRGVPVRYRGVPIGAVQQ